MVMVKMEKIKKHRSNGKDKESIKSHDVKRRHLSLLSNFYFIELPTPQKSNIFVGKRTRTKRFISFSFCSFISCSLWLIKQWAVFCRTNSVLFVFDTEKKKKDLGFLFDFGTWSTYYRIDFSLRHSFEFDWSCRCCSVLFISMISSMNVNPSSCSEFQCVRKEKRREWRTKSFFFTFFFRN